MLVAGKLCPYCQNRIAADSEATICPACNTPHHTECWNYNGGCTTFGCREMPGAVRTVASAPVIDDDLGIELHPPAGGYSTPHNQGWGQQPQSRGNTNWAVAISAIFVIIFIGMLVAVVSVGSKKSNDTPYMRAAIQAIDSKDYEDAITYCSLAISADPKSTAAYYLKGKLLLELMENRSDSFEKLVYLAKTGETSRLDEADDCFEQCILTTPSDENISVEYLDMTSAEVVGSSRIFMALTATLRAIANSHADHPDYARQWATIARQNIRYARQHNLSSKYDRLIQILENIASDYSR
jgi:tetratricopeptide (TPR) repeat protein